VSTGRLRGIAARRCERPVRSTGPGESRSDVPAPRFRAGWARTACAALPRVRANARRHAPGRTPACGSP